MSKELMQQNIEKAQCEIDSKKNIVKGGKSCAIYIRLLIICVSMPIGKVRRNL